MLHSMVLKWNASKNNGLPHDNNFWSICNHEQYLNSCLAFQTSNLCNLDACGQAFSFFTDYEVWAPYTRNTVHLKLTIMKSIGVFVDIVTFGRLIQPFASTH